MWDTYWGIILFAIVTSGTPGPNNLMMLSSGSNFGMRRSLPHLLGISIGFPVMLLILSIGSMPILMLNPQVLSAIKIIGMCYLLYLAWRIANSSVDDHVLESKKIAKPLTCFQSALFQWANPKAWIVAAGAVSTYLIPNQMLSHHMVWVVLIFVAAGFLCCGSWLLMGRHLRLLLKRPLYLRIFNYVAAGLLVCSMIPELNL